MIADIYYDAPIIAQNTLRFSAVRLQLRSSQLKQVINMVLVACWLAVIGVTNVIQYFRKNGRDESDDTVEKEKLSFTERCQSCQLGRAHLEPGTSTHSPASCSHKSSDREFVDECQSRQSGLVQLEPGSSSHSPASCSHKSSDREFVDEESTSYSAERVSRSHDSNIKTREENTKVSQINSSSCSAEKVSNNNYSSINSPTCSAEKVSMSHVSCQKKEEEKPQVRQLEKEKSEERRGNDGWVSNLSGLVLTKVLGEGAFGRFVYIVQKQEYAVKEIKDFESESYEIERKVLALGCYKCNNFITKLCGEFIHEDHLFFVLKYMRGGDLHRVLRRNKGRFSEARTRFYTAEVICGLEFLHANGIVHRDLKLENVLMGGDGHVKIADFGLCVDEMWAGTKIQEEGITGTPLYTAPEVILEQPYDSSCDWWSLCVMVFIMITFKKPFTYSDLPDLYEAICHEKLLFPQMSRFARDLLMQDCHRSDTVQGMLKFFKLLERNPVERIGYRDGCKPLIREHSFFGQINWMLLEAGKLEPPWTPRR
ncbi:protein kinase C delta type-like [Oculina patagonica]